MTVQYIKEIGRNPQVDWIAIVSLSVLIGAVLVSGSVYLYISVTKGTILESASDVSNTIRSIDEKTFSAIVESFIKKEETSKKAQTGYAGPGDPSVMLK